MKPSTATLLTVLFLAWTGLVAAAPATTLRTDAEIRALIGSQRWNDAIAASRERIAASPDEAEPHVLLGTAMFLKARAAAPAGTVPAIAASEADAIAKELETAITLAPQRKDVYLGLVDVETAAGRDDRVLEQIKRCAAQFPADAKAAASLLEYGFERQSRQDPLVGPILQAVYQGYPRQPAVVTAYASHVLSVGELDQAVELLRTANATVAQNTDLLEAFGDALSYRLEFDAAARQYGAAAALDATRRGVRLKWAAALHTSDPKNAQILVDPLRIEGGRTSLPTVGFGKDGSLQTPGRISRCATAFWKVLGQNPPSALDVYNMGKTFLQSGFGPQGLAETQVALARNPSQIESWMLRAEIYTRAGLDKQALEALDKADAVFDALKEAPSAAFTRDEVLAARAAVLSRLNRNEEALASYRRLGDASRFTYQIALINERLGHVDEARSLLEKVATTGTNAAEVEAAKARLEREPYRKKP